MGVVCALIMFVNGERMGVGKVGMMQAMWQMLDWEAGILYRYRKRKPAHTEVRG